MASNGKEEKQSAHDDAAEAQDIAHDVTAKAKSMASSAASSAKEAAAHGADTAKNAAAHEVGNVASALRKAAAASRSGSPQERTIGQIADSLADASEAIGNKDLGTVVTDVSNFARKHPLTFLAGAALAGVAVSRFAKASERVEDVAKIDEVTDQRGA